MSISVLDCGNGWLWIGLPACIVPKKKKKDKKDKNDKQHQDEKEPDRIEIDIGLDAALPGLALAHVTEKGGQEGQERQAAQERRDCERPANSPWSLFAQNAPIHNTQHVSQGRQRRSIGSLPHNS